MDNQWLFGTNSSHGQNKSADKMPVTTKSNCGIWRPHQITTAPWTQPQVSSSAPASTQPLLFAPPITLQWPTVTEQAFIGSRPSRTIPHRFQPTVTCAPTPMYLPSSSIPWQQSPIYPIAQPPSITLQPPSSSSSPQPQTHFAIQEPPYHLPSSQYPQQSLPNRVITNRQPPQQQHPVDEIISAVSQWMNPQQPGVHKEFAVDLAEAYMEVRRRRQGSNNGQPYRAQRQGRRRGRGRGRGRGIKRSEKTIMIN